MKPERWQQISAIYQQAAARTAKDRDAYVIHACGADTELRREVEALLAQGESFLANPVSLPSRTRLGAYELVEVVGAGGMGIVYRARDLKLQRDVALKVLPDAVALDPERVARFRREATVLASLNHPNIGAIYGFEDSGDVHALVLELVEGPTLADRIAQGAIPLDEALSIARQIAEALEAAHEQGIIHRDLKPANIKLRPDGTVKVLDFGLAKALEPVLSNAETAASLSPTITSPAVMSGVGVLLGTAAYMSPEQAKGKPADKRSDIWAFGCVLYEMLTGKRAFEGDDISDTLANILKAQPDWRPLSATTPVAIRRLLRRSLEKDRKRRLSDIADLRLELDEALNPQDLDRAEPLAPTAPVTRWRRIATYGLTSLAGAAVVGTIIWFGRPLPTLRVTRLTISVPGSAAVAQGQNRYLAISPDGARVVYVANNGDGGLQRGATLFVRTLTQLEATSLTSTSASELNTAGAVSNPFFSADGEWVAFYASGTLKKVRVDGGAVSTIGTTPFLGQTSGTWSEDGTVVFASNPVSPSGLWKISAAGGQPIPLTRPDAARGEVAHAWPHFLPGGHAVLFTVLTGSYRAEENAQIALLDLRTGAQKMLVRGSDAHYVQSGHLVYGRAGTLEAVAFDLTRQEVTSAPVSLVPGVAIKVSGAYDFDVSRDGSLAYLKDPGPAVQRRLVWVDRQGREESIKAPPAGYTTLRLSPDETRIAMDINDGQKRDIWVWELAREVLQRLTNDPEQNVVPVWAPDSRHLVYSAGPPGRGNLVWQPADGSGAAERLTHSSNGQYPSAVLSDNRVIFREEVGSDRDLMMVALTGNRQPAPLVKTRFVELNGEVSPDSKWLAYEANDSGRFEIYVRPFPNVAAARTLVSIAGGTKPLWGRSARELFYLAADGALMSVAVTPGITWNAGKPTKVLDKGYFAENAGGARGFDVSADGGRFLMIKDVESSDKSAKETPQIVIVQNWFQELKRLVPANK